MEMSEKTKYFVVKQKAVPEVLLKVVEAKRLLESSKAMTVQEATERVGISRSSFYKYKDDIFPFHDNTRGRTLTFMLQLDDKPGLLSNVLGILANAKANVLTIHQAIPTGGIASITLSVEIQPETEDTEKTVQVPFSDFIRTATVSLRLKFRISERLSKRLIQ
jgi:chorismate mutase